MIKEVAGFKMHVETDMEKYRYESFWEKEPETLAWIESFAGDTFIDVGANVGVYSLYCASLHPDMQIYAFEPVLKNFIRLCQNIELNGFNIAPFNLALGSQTNFNDIYIPTDSIADSGAQIAFSKDEHGKEFKPEYISRILEVRFDDIFKDKVDYIKIDVDGNEYSILEGMPKTLRNIKSMLVEFNYRHGCVFDSYAAGFSTDNEFNKHQKHSRNRRGGNPENVIFTRDVSAV